DLQFARPLLDLHGKRQHLLARFGVKHLSGVSQPAQSDDLQPGFFAQFPRDGLVKRLPRLDPTRRERPRRSRVVRPLLLHEQDVVAAIHERGCDHCDGWLRCHGFLYSWVRMSGSPRVTTTVCSYCAARLPSDVVSAHPSSPLSTLLALIERNGSMVKTMPSVSRI